MKPRILLIATILSAGMSFSMEAYSQDYSPDRTTHNEQANVDPRLVANRFVKHVNYARLELAMNHPDLAKQHIARARELAMIIDNETAEQRNETEVESGRIALSYDRSYKDYYFPIETGSIEGQKPSNPLWIQKGAKITDAEIIYLTLDLGNDKTASQLNQAETAIDDGKLKDADVDLAKISAAAVTNHYEASEPAEKTRDNIALARRFIMDANYDGARYALTHADDGLNDMQEDDTYHAHHRHIVAMRKQIKDMQATIARNDPTMLQKTDAKLAKWWDELKGWAHT